MIHGTAAILATLANAPKPVCVCLLSGSACMSSFSNMSSRILFEYLLWTNYIAASPQKWKTWHMQTTGLVMVIGPQKSIKTNQKDGLGL